MKFQFIINTLKERMADASFLPLLLLGLIGFAVFVAIIWRYGYGILMAMPFILVGLQITKSDLINGLALAGRFILILFLVAYAFFNRKNRVRFSPAAFFLLLIPVAMILNSGRAYEPLGAFSGGVFFLLMFLGIVIGGQKILADSRGRSTFVITLSFFAIIMACVQIPYLGTSSGRLEGIFENVVGFMTVGTMGVVILTWAAMNQRVWSFKFFFYGMFAVLTLILLVLTAGRTALATVVIGIFVIIARKVRRNVLIILIFSAILAPIGLKILTSFPGFEQVKNKLFTQESSGREYLFSLAWNEISQKPLFGWGTDSAFVKGQIEVGTQYHNSYLMFAVDHGIPFGIMVLILFLWLPVRGLLLMRKCPTEEMKNMANLSSSFLVGYTFANFLGGGFHAITGMIIVSTAIALQEGVRAELLSSCEHEPSGEEFFSGGPLGVDNYSGIPYPPQT